MASNKRHLSQNQGATWTFADFCEMSGKFGSGASNATIRTGLGGDLSPLERSILGDMLVDTGFTWKTGLCAKFANFGQ
jgi:hypothetical protein